MPNISSVKTSTYTYRNGDFPNVYAITARSDSNRRPRSNITTTTTNACEHVRHTSSMKSNMGLADTSNAYAMYEAGTRIAE